MTQLVVRSSNHPMLNLMAEDKHQRGQREGNMHDGNQQQRAHPPLPESPFAARKTIGAAKAFHQREHHAEARQRR